MTNYEEQLATLCEDVQQFYQQAQRSKGEVDRLIKISDSVELINASSALLTARSYLALAASRLGLELISERGKS